MAKRKPVIVALSRRAFLWLRDTLSIASALTTFMFVVWLETEG